MVHMPGEALRNSRKQGEDKNGKNRLGTGDTATKHPRKVNGVGAISSRCSPALDHTVAAQRDLEVMHENTPRGLPAQVSLVQC